MGGDPLDEGHPEHVNDGGYWQGGQPLRSPFVSPNITPDAERLAGRSGPGPQFRGTSSAPGTIRIRPRAGALLQVMPWPASTAKMTDRDLQAVYEYLAGHPLAA